MKFMVQFDLKPGTKDKAVKAFEERGPNRNPGVKFLDAWVSRHSDVVFVLVEAEGESQVIDAGQSWAALGKYQIHPVIDIQQF